MTDYKATPEQWAQCEDWVKSSVVGASDACILELRTRVEALEASQQQPEPIDQEENDRRFHACMDLIKNATPEQIRAAAGLPERPASKVHEISKPLKLTPEQAQQVRDLLAPNSKPTPNPSQIRSSLVERVQGAIHDVEFPHGNDEARAAIREVAAWMTSNPDVYFPPALVFALEKEAER
jgi:hypothetical protein